MTQPAAFDDGADRVERVEHRWAAVSVVIVVLLVVIATFAGLYHAAMPQSRVETVDPRTLHLGGEFIESNLGSALEADGSITVRFVASVDGDIPPNAIVTPEGWNYLIRFYRPRAEVLDGSWTPPTLTPYKAS